MELAELVTDMQNADGARKRRTLNALPSTTNADILAYVATFLGDETPAVCEAAVEALVRASHPSAAAAAVAHLTAPEPAERGYALETLIGLKQAALPHLAALLNSPDHDLRKYAVDALSAARCPQAAPLLVTALGDGDVNVAAAAAEALGLLGVRDAMPALQEALVRGPD